MNAPLGIALLCDVSGVVRRVLHNAFTDQDEELIGRAFPALAVHGSLNKALSFLREIKEKGAAFDWEIILLLNDHMKTLHFAGGMLDEMVLIVGAENGRYALKLYEEMVRMNNEQVNALRAALKSQSRPDQDERLFDEISRLNNELVAMQRELAKKNAELRQLNEEKNRFLGMAAHDLRNPLHAVLAYAEFLMDHLQDEKSRGFLQVIRNSCEFMTRLVDNLLDVAKIEAGELNLELSAIDLAELAENNAVIQKSFADRKQVEIDYRLERVPMIVADRVKLEQVLNNLLRNAIKFSQPGGRVVVRVQPDGDGVLLAVQDHGVGMTAEEQANLFKPFQKGRSGTGGEKSTGLGLVIVKRIIEGHGGTIQVESRSGEGTTFTIRLPRRPQ